MTTASYISRHSTPPLYKTLGERIKTARVATGMSQVALAERIGTHRTSLTLIESGQQRCAIHELLAIAKVLSIPAGELLAELEA